MKKLAFEEILSISDYEARRRDIRRAIVELKQNRRVTLGSQVTLLFENTDTVRFQMQEMLRLDCIAEPDAIRRELELFNELIPDPHELSATMFIEVGDAERFTARLASFEGVQDGGVSLQIGGEVVPAVFDAGLPGMAPLSAVQYLSFPLTGTQEEAFCSPTIPAFLRIRHNDYVHEQALPDDVRASLIGDLLP